MEEKLPKKVYSHNEDNFEARKNLILTVFNRKSYEWDIMCERNETTSRGTFYRQLNGMRYYFYSPQEQAMFAAVDQQRHSHSIGIDIADHDDYHNPSQFHVHMGGRLPIEASRESLQVNQGLVLCYLIFILIMFIQFAVRKPQR